MHELSLDAQIPASRYSQILHVLAGITAMPPKPFAERHMVFKPGFRPARVDATDRSGGSQNVKTEKKRHEQSQGPVKLWIETLVQILTPNRGFQDSDSDDSDDEMSEVSEPEEVKWELRWFDVPDATVTQATSRAVDKMQIVDNDPMKFMENLNLRYVDFLLPV